MDLYEHFCVHTLSILHDLPSLGGIANAIEYQHHGAHDNGIIIDGQQVAFYQETDAKRENLILPPFLFDFFT